MSDSNERETPPSPHELVGKDELDEDDEMELTGEDVVGEAPEGPQLR